tara:strand:+ start:8170 stop:8463 length:294 start_codon:yes stop_codon:yes gene_type:complete
MRNTITRYQQNDFIVRVEEDNYYMEIIGFHKHTGKSSNICNLNYILSALDIPEDEHEETCWKVTEELIERCHNLFSYDNKYLQMALYEDYLDGGWLT